MKKLQLGALALAATLLVGGGTVFAAQNKEENNLVKSVEATNEELTAEEKAEHEKMLEAAVLTTPSEASQEPTAEEKAEYEKALENGTLTESVQTTEAIEATAEERAEYEKMLEKAATIIPNEEATN